MKKIFALSILSISLIGCGGISEQEEETDEVSIPSPVIITPPKYEMALPVISDNKNLSLAFSLSSTQDSDSFQLVSPSGNNPLKSVELSLSFKDESMKDYILNFTDVSEKINDINENWKNININTPQEVSLNFLMDHLPAEFLQDELTPERVLNNAITVGIKLDNGQITRKNININVLNENSLPYFNQDQQVGYVFSERTENMVIINLNDDNLNDNLSYRIKKENYDGFTLIHMNDLDCTEFCETGNSVILNLSTKDITTQSVVEEFIIEVIDNSLENGELNIVSLPITVTTENINDDLTPSITISENEYTVNESSGIEISYNVESPKDSPTAPVSVSFSLDLDENLASVVHDVENKKIVISNININENLSRVLTLTASTNGFTSSVNTLLNFQNDVDRSPQVMITSPNPSVISEENGGVINYAATLNNPSRNLSTTFEIDVPNDEIVVNHNSVNQTITFSNINIKENYSTVLTVFASDGVDVSSSQINIEFINDIDREKEEFIDRYNVQKNYYNNLINRDDEVKLFSFYEELAEITNLNAEIINETRALISQNATNEKNELLVLFNKLENFTTVVNPSEEVIAAAEEDLSSFKIKLENYGLKSVNDLNNFILQLDVTVPLLSATKNRLTPNNVFSRYIALATYGRYIDVEQNIWIFNQNYKMLELVNPNYQCN